MRERHFKRLMAMGRMMKSDEFKWRASVFFFFRPAVLSGAESIQTTPHMKLLCR